MNLRLDERSFRVRVCVDECRALLDQKHLTTRLAMPSPLTLEVMATNGSTETRVWREGDRLLVQIPRDALLKVASGLNGADRTSMQIRTVSPFGDVLFEVDLFDARANRKG